MIIKIQKNVQESMRGLDDELFQQSTEQCFTAKKIAFEMMKQSITSIEDATDRIFNFTCEALTVDQTDEFKDFIEICEDLKILPLNPSNQSKEQRRNFAAALQKYLEYILSTLLETTEVSVNVIVQLKAIFELWFFRNSLREVTETQIGIIRNIQEILETKYEHYLELQRKQAAEIKEAKQIKAQQFKVPKEKLKKKKASGNEQRKKSGGNTAWSSNSQDDDDVMEIEKPGSHKC